MIEYPKIETLYNRNPDDMKRVIVGPMRKGEFSLINNWLVTEKVDGMNIRVTFTGGTSGGNVRINGRTDNATLHPTLIEMLQAGFSAKRFESAFDYDVVRGADPFSVTLYGEAYGPKVQSGGWYRDSGWGFRLFDVRVGDWWLNWEDVQDVAGKMGTDTVPVLANGATTREAVNLVMRPSRVQAAEKLGYPAMAGTGVRQQEGVVARTNPLLLDRRGHRIMWKLKVRDLE